MKRIFAGLPLFLAAYMLAAAEQQLEWVKVSPKGSNCEILFPAQPKVKPYKDGVQFVLERQGGKAALMLQYNTLSNPLDIGNPKQVKLFFNGGRDGMLRGVKGAKLLSEKDIWVDKKYPARDIDAEFPGFGVYRMHIIVTGRKVYQITLLGSKDYQNSAEAKKFLESFKLTN